MKRTASIALALALACLIGSDLEAASSRSQSAHKQAAQAAEAKKKRAAATRSEPAKRQNFRARRADEISPWEGFEDCPMGFPCVGAFGPN